MYKKIIIILLLIIAIELGLIFMLKTKQCGYVCIKNGDLYQENKLCK